MRDSSLSTLRNLAALSILGMSLVAAFADWRMHRQNRILDAALNNMAQGLVMFDKKSYA